jgi:hypothetical protein
MSENQELSRKIRKQRESGLKGNKPTFQKFEKIPTGNERTMKKELAQPKIEAIFNQAEATVKDSQRKFKKYSPDWTFSEGQLVMLRELREKIFFSSADGSKAKKRD